MAHHHSHYFMINQLSSDHQSNIIPWPQSSDQYFGVQATGTSDHNTLELPTSKHFNSRKFSALNDHNQTAISRSWSIEDSSLSSKEKLASFNMKQTETPQSLHNHEVGSRDRILLQYQRQQLFMQNRSTSSIHPIQQQQQQPLMLFQLKNSKYLSAAQEVLNELCSLGEANSSKIKLNKAKIEEGEQPYSSSMNLHSMDLLELQKTKANLLPMLEEVDKRYQKYCDQMRGVVASFESVAGEGAAGVYSTLASKAMSRHFRCLRDGITLQIRLVKKVMGEKEDTISPSGETPRLKKLDQCIRQHKAFQLGMMEQHPWRPQRGLPERAVSILRAWLFEHFLHPYPNDVDKQILSRETGLSRSQVSNWFINARVRLWKPMVEQMYMEEMKDRDDEEQEQHEDYINNSNPNENPNSISYLAIDDHKPNLPLHHLLDDSNDQESLSSIINSTNSTHDHQNTTTNNASLHLLNHSFGHTINHYEHFLYSNQHVSLTLGLQQHGSVNLAFSSNSNEQMMTTSDDDNQ